MDGLILDVPSSERIAPFVPPVCLSPMTAQVLALALIVLLCVVCCPAKRSQR